MRREKPIMRGLPVLTCKRVNFFSYIQKKKGREEKFRPGSFHLNGISLFHPPSILFKNPHLFTSLEI